jgi:DNA invertase Pin-like site-specific DNA recombinase
MHGVVTFQKNNSGELIRAGMYLAQKNGVKLGRKKVFTETQAQELRQKRREGAPIKDLMNQYSMSRATIYRALASKY